MFGGGTKRLRTIEQPTQLFMKLQSSTGLRRSWLELQWQFLPYYFTAPPSWRVHLRKLSSASRVSPDFLALGAVRSGTTTLADYIMQHRCVVLPLAKELS